MSLKPLIQRQTLKIDDHKWGSKERKNWDRSHTDVHIDKSTKYPINGKNQNVRIRIPINSDRPLNVENQKGSTLEKVPRKLEKEIKSAFEDRETREAFINDLVDILSNYDSVLDTTAKVSEALGKISRHFDLKWTDQNIQSYVNGYLSKYTQIYTDDSGEQYYITIDEKKIKIGSVDNWTRARMGVKKCIK